MTEWQPIETAPELERIMVCGWSKATRWNRGYWWWQEDAADHGRAIDSPDALYWAPIILPPFPKPPGK